MSELALYETAKEALATAVRIDEVIDIHDQARRAQAYAKIARDRRLVADAQELIARAERKLGIMLRRVKEQGLLSSGGRPSNSNLDEPETGADAEPVFDSTSFTLAELGISKKLSSRAQALAELDDDDFESSVSEARDKTLAADAAVISPKRIKVAPAAKPAKAVALEPRRFHQFVVSLLAMSFAGDRVSSIGIWDLARTTGIVEGADDDIEFTAEAYAALGALAATALLPMVGNENSQAKASEDGGANVTGESAPDDSVTGDASRASDGAGTVAPIQLGTATEAPMEVYGDSVEAATAPLSESVDILLGGEMVERLDGADQPPAVSHLPETANETAGGFPVAAAPGKAEQQGAGKATREANLGTSLATDVTAGETASQLLEKARLREAYDGEVALLLPHKGKLTMLWAEAALRAGYAAEVPVLLIAEDLGHPVGTVKSWAHRLELTSKDRMHAVQQRFGASS
jgi:hypothetical protein